MKSTATKQHHNGGIKVDDVSTWIEAVRRFSRSSCYTTPEWDAQDLESYILHDLTRWPPRFPGEVIKRCHWSLNNWHRDRLGNIKTKTRKHEFFAQIKLDQPISSTAVFGDMLQDESSFEDEVIAAADEKALLGRFHAKYQKIAKMLIDGHNQSSIAQELGISRALVSRNVKIIRDIVRQWA